MCTCMSHKIETCLPSNHFVGVSKSRLFASSMRHLLVTEEKCSPCLGTHPVSKCSESNLFLLQGGNFRPGALSPKTRFLGMLPNFLSDMLCWGKNHRIEILQGDWCEFVHLVFFWLFWHLPNHCTGHLDQSMDGSDEAYTLQAESRCVQVCVIFGQKLALQEFLGKLGRFSGRN